MLIIVLASDSEFFLDIRGTYHVLNGTKICILARSYFYFNLSKTNGTFMD